MRFFVFNMFTVACYLMLLVVDSFGVFLTIREPKEVRPPAPNYHVEYTCISEDNREALVWNYDLDYYTPKRSSAEKPNSVPHKKSEVCALVEEDYCIASWILSKNWEVVNSSDNPLGPVSDSRWEDFAEMFFSRNSWEFVMEIRAAGATVFSVRGYGSVIIRFCKMNINQQCLFLKIGTYYDTNEEKKSNQCTFEDEEDAYHAEAPCPKLVTFPHEKPLIDRYLWNSLVLEWTTDSIKVCSEIRCLYSIALRGRSLEGRRMFIGMEDKGLIRFHFYEYSLATKRDVELVSKKFHHDGQNLCIELTVNLCDKCKLDVYVIDSENKSQLIGNISQNFNSESLPPWQVFKLNKTLHNFKNYLKLKIVTIRNDTYSKGQWGIGHFRKCKPVGTIRNLIFDESSLRISYSSVEPRKNCQNMFTRHSIGAARQDLSACNVSDDTREYLRENSYGNTSFSSYPIDCSNESLICDQYGCVCAHKNDDDTDVQGFTERTTYRPPISFPELNDSNVRIIHQKNGVVSFSWNFPENFFRIMNKCQITVQYNCKTSLRTTASSMLNWTTLNCSGVQQHNFTLGLLPSTSYLLFVNITNTRGDGRNYSKGFVTPASLGFKEAGNLNVNVTGSLLRLRLPSIVNETSNSTVTVIVKGSSTCAKPESLRKFRKLVNMTKSEKGWITRSYSANQSRPTRTITIGKPLASPQEDLKCYPLHPGETYTILVVVVDEETNASAFIASLPISISHITTDVKNTYDEKSVSGWHISLFIIAVCLLLFFIWRRRVITSVKRVRRRNLILSSQTFANFIKTKTTPIFEQPVASIGASTDVLYSAIIDTYGEYGESVPNHSATCISVEDFENYVKESIANDILKSQFKMFPKGILKPSTHGLLPNNKLKNRYTNIVPYDDTRVVLERISDDCDSDYINANYVQGYCKKKAYIAAQGPKPQTVEDFWRMIWQEEVMVICMLANVFERQRTKCEKYWPEIEHSRTYGDIVVVTENHQALADYVLRTFRVSCRGETRKIEHMHYTGWPDHTVPSYTHSMVAFLAKFRTMETGKGPVVVHCSAGVGRTGTFILCDMCVRQAAATGKIDVLTEFRKLRDCRLNMVDTESQYKFVHIVIAEFLVSTKLPCDNTLLRAMEFLKKQLPDHIRRLNDIAWQDEALCPGPVILRPPIPENLVKNRIPELAPVSNSLVYLKRYPQHEIHSDYINAVIVDGLMVKKQFLASQLPLPSTLSDFWRLVAEQEVRHIIVLQQPDPDDPTCCNIIADENSFDPVPFINVKVKTSTGTQGSLIINKLLLTDKSECVVPKTRQISMLKCTEWGLGRNGKPPPPQKLVQFWIASQNICREEGPTLVLCHDGVTGCGLYLALSSLLERMAVERECDVILAVRAVRRTRSDFVQSQKQFEYLYDAAAKYIETFETYANFS